jgi:proteasome accessory factor A
VQFNRAIINARDEPLADYRKYRRLHLLIGDSNMSPFATALKIGTTACVLTLLEQGRLPKGLILLDAVQSTRDVSRDPTHAWLVHLENGDTIGSLTRSGNSSSLRRSISRARRRDRLAAGELELHARCSRQ